MIQQNGSEEHDSKARRRWLQTLVPGDERCRVPGCHEGKITDDCCYQHSLNNSDARTTLPNDGIIDWKAIEVAAKGIRRVRLTWVEKDIALAMILHSGGSLTDAEERLGISIVGTRQRHSRRIVAATKILEALDGGQ